MKLKEDVKLKKNIPLWNLSAEDSTSLIEAIHIQSFVKWRRLASNNPALASGEKLQVLIIFLLVSQSLFM